MLDSTGRPVQMTNALNQVTKLAYDSDNNVTSLTEDNGATTTWTYDPNTGYPLTHTDALGNKNGTAPTTYTYQTGLSGHIADLIAKLTPQQRLWTFGYDTNGNLTSVTDPDGNATSPPSGFTTTYTYDSFGRLLTATDANGNKTSYSNHDPSGYPQTITDALQNPTTITYDARGNVTQVTDPLGHVTTQAYDFAGIRIASRARVRNHWRARGRERRWASLWGRSRASKCGSVAPACAFWVGSRLASRSPWGSGSAGRSTSA